MKIIVSGGGTGGHIYPALAVARGLRQKGWEILYLGSEGGLEQRVVPGHNIELKLIRVNPLPRSPGLKLAKALAVGVRGLFQANRHIRDFKPDLVLGTGGYVAGPVLLAASLRGCPTLIHEQNVYPGITNRLLAYTADRVALNFRAAREYFPRNRQGKFVVTGNPVRREILEASRTRSLAELGLADNCKTLLVFGGSQGASTINRALLDCLDDLLRLDWLQIIFITGDREYPGVEAELKSRGLESPVESGLVIKPYLEHMEWAYAAADLVLYRAGATGLAEITARGLPAILVPYPHATGDHQHFNARNMADQGAALMIEDGDLTGDRLCSVLLELLGDESKLQEMSKASSRLGHPEATDLIIREIENMVESID
ncbi:MAG: undecaprenyldiphospho-muramoylpentapeptide beta-N-acetylglucosaminyltransferase [Bacillota bacterium]